MDTTTLPHPAPPSLAPDAPAPRASRDGFLVRRGRDVAYVVSGFALGVVGFVVVVAGVSAGLGLLVVWFGLAVLAGTALAARGLARLERRALTTLQGWPAPPARYLRAPEGSGVVRRVLTPLRDPQSWLDLLWGLVSFVTGTVAFTVVVSWLAAAGAGLTYWFWQQWLPDQDETLVELLGWGQGRRDESLLQLGIGVVALLTLPLVVRACAALHAGPADALLNSRARQRG
ncbi:sensor domain-containing protein [Nocardioides sp. C4-1]|uniref:sensor domain-containing protein n=1 Tax=Nocardioides sp. C4-1 TaxID=3151851 RepID=UPI0032638F1C